MVEVDLDELSLLVVRGPLLPPHAEGERHLVDVAILDRSDEVAYVAARRVDLGDSEQSARVIRAHFRQRF